MPRKSQSSLSIVPPIPGQGYPEPPSELDALEERIWRKIVGALPGHWVDQAAQQVLRRAVAQAAVCERLEERLRLLRKVGDDGDEDYDVIVTSHGAAAKTLAALLTTLRATPKSQTLSRAARRDQTPENRPWEIKADAPA
jgi:hypothetical protein